MRQFIVWKLCKQQILLGDGIKDYIVYKFFSQDSLDSISRPSKPSSLKWEITEEYPFTQASWQNQQNDCAPSKDSDQPGHLLCTHWAAKDPSFLNADSKDSDQTWRMPRLIWVFAGRICHFAVFVMRWLSCIVFWLFGDMHVHRIVTFLKSQSTSKGNGMCSSQKRHSTSDMFLFDRLHTTKHKL